MTKFKAFTKPDVVEEPTTFPDAVAVEGPNTEPKHSFCGICNATVKGRIDHHLVDMHTHVD